MNTIEQARETAAWLRKHLRAPNAADTIDALITELEVERSCCELAVKQAETLVNQRNRLTAELASSKQQEQPHTDHPLRHYDQTCPACVKGEA